MAIGSSFSCNQARALSECGENWRIIHGIKCVGLRLICEAATVPVGDVVGQGHGAIEVGDGVMV